MAVEVPRPCTAGTAEERAPIARLARRASELFDEAARGLRCVWYPEDEDGEAVDVFYVSYATCSTRIQKLLSGVAHGGVRV